MRARARIRKRARDRKPLPDLRQWREAAAIPEAQDLAGYTLDSRYQLGAIIARGGFASVLQGRDLQQNGRRCAVKVFRRELLDQDSLLRRFEEEVSALEKLKHANIVHIYGHGSTPEGVPYLVMEYIEGQTLRELIQAGPLPARRTAGFLRQTGAALAAIHEQGIYHRDLKPENIMIRSEAPADEDLVLIDFSIAIVKDPKQSLRALSRAAGTVDYMAPEHSIGYADESTDIYNLAKLIVEMLTGQRFSSLVAVASLDLPKRVRVLLSGLTVKLSNGSMDLISNALEFHPASRSRSAFIFANSIANDLESVAET
jgi:serine/threonine protein kinase